MTSNKTTKTSRSKVNPPADTGVSLGGRHLEGVRISVIDYDESTFQERQVKTVEECFPLKDTPTVSWINIEGKGEAVIAAFGERFGMHPVVQGNIMREKMRPKLEEFDDYLYLVFYAIDRNHEKRIQIDRISMMIGKNFLITFQQDGSEVYEAIRGHLRTGVGRIRRMGTDYLAYMILDSTIDRYFTILEEVGDQVGVLEQTVPKAITAPAMHTLHQIKRELIFIHRAVWPLREVIAKFERLDSPLVHDTSRAYLRDVYEHTIQVIETLETYRDLLSGQMDVYLSVMSHRLNEIIKVLTIITTIFIPLSFIAGVYGMNFRHMPGLYSPLGFPALLGLMTLVAGGMLMYFKHRKWL